MKIKWNREKHFWHGEKFKDKRLIQFKKFSNIERNLNFFPLQKLVSRRLEKSIIFLYAIFKKFKDKDFFS